MKYAWQLWRATKQAWRVCMIKAWELYRLAKKMREGTVSFYYQKADGSIRKAVGTLRNLFLPAQPSTAKDDQAVIQNLCLLRRRKERLPLLQD